MPKKDTRARVWTFIVYPESAPESWRDVLDSQHVAWVESPLHDKDINPDGTLKKPHWHIIFFFDNKKSYEQILEITQSVNATIPQKVPSPKGLVRYLVHMDNPEKYQYKRADILCHSGADIDPYFELSLSSKNEILYDIYQFILDSEIDNYADFIKYCLENHELDWLDVVSHKNTISVRALIDGVYQKNHPKDKSGQSDKLADKVSVAKEMAKNGTKSAVIADTLGVSERTVWRYLKK